MASYKSQFNTTNSSRTENADPTSQKTHSSTRLPTRKNVPIQPQSNVPIYHSPSKLTKKRPNPSTDNVSTSRGAQTQEGGIPKAATGKDARKQKAAAAAITASDAASSRIARFDAPFARTPSLVSGSSASTVESPRSNVLRRKPSNIGRTASKARKGSLESQEDTAVMDTLNALSDPFPDSVLGIAMPLTSMGISKDGIPNADSFKAASHYMPTTLTTMAMPPPTPLYALSATPSTGYSGSPGPFSIASTPTSMSSFSPGTTVTSKETPRIRQPSPTIYRPPVTRRRPSDAEERGLSYIRESSSSSSASTVQNGETSRRRAKARVEHLPAPPPSPPTRPRTSWDRKPEPLTVSPRPNTAMHPPELAHLVDAKPIQRLPAATRPVRPSREGTPDYVGLRDPSPIIQSNLSSLPLGFHKRQTSAESRDTGVSSTSTSSKTRFGQPAKLSPRLPSPSPSQLSTFSPTQSRTPVTRGTTPEIPSDTEKNLKKGAVPPPSPSKSGSRFGFFRRKTDPATPAVPIDKRPRKGPVAGTGHEGYGKYGLPRGRSGSTTSGTSSDGGSPSAESETGSGPRSAASPRLPTSRKSSVGNKVSPEMDDFFRERLEPVTLRGEGAGGRDARPDIERAKSADTASGAHFQRRQQRRANDAAVSRPADISAAQAPVLPPTAGQHTQRSQSPVKRGPSAPPTAQSSSRFGLKTLGGRRLSRISLDLEGKVVPTPSTASNASSVAPSPQVGGSKTWQPASGSSKLEPAPKSATYPVPKQQGKLTRKWNFFQRANSSLKKETVIHTLPAAPSLQFQPSTRSMAHYALMDRGPKVDIDELEQIMQEANESPDEMEPEQDEQDRGADLGVQLLPEDDEDPNIELLPEEVLQEEAFKEQAPSRPAHGHSILLPARPFLPPALDQHARSASPVVHLRRQSQEPNVVAQAEQRSPICTTVLNAPEQSDPSQTSPLVPMPPQRAPRLQQVGRIPQVKRDRERERKVSVHSFSRPFGNDGSPALQQQSPPIGSHSPEPEEVDLDLPLQQPPPLNDMVAQLRIPSFSDGAFAACDPNRLSSQTTTTIDPTAMDGAAEFLAFPPRHDSDISASTSSGHPSFKTLLATAPPVAAEMEDEVWNEYDDLIDDVLSLRSMKDLKSARFHGSSLGLPLQCPNVTPLNLTSHHRRPSNATASSGHLSTASRFLPSLPTAPNSPFSISDFLTAYGERDVSIATIDAANARLSMPPNACSSGGSAKSAGSARLSFPSSARPSSQPSSSQPTTESRTATSRPTTMSSSSSNSPKHRQPRTSTSTATPEHVSSDDKDGASSSLDDEDGLESMANLRFGALMTSKWLSFGRVLFSPAHFELKDPKEDRVLILDGLGKGIERHALFFIILRRDD